MKSLFAKISIAAPFLSLLLAHALAKDAVLSKVTKAADTAAIMHLTRASHTSALLPNANGLGWARGHRKLRRPAQTVGDETI